MASLSSISKQITGLIPPELRDEYGDLVPEWVSDAVEEVGKLREWDWRKRLASISITTTDTTYDMPSDCDIISSKPAILQDTTNSKPTKNRVVLMSWETFNQRYLEGQEETETAGVPQFMVPWPQLSSMSNIQIRIYPISNATYTLSVLYYSSPSSNDAKYQLSSLIKAHVRGFSMPAALEPESARYAAEYRFLMKQLLPHEAKAQPYREMFAPDPAFVKHQQARRNRK